MGRVIFFALAMLVGASSATSAGDALIVFGNGIKTLENEAWLATEVLHDVITGDPRFAGYVLDFDYAYNQTVCPPDSDCWGVGDILESVTQTLTTLDDSTFWAYYYGLRTEPQDEFAFVTETANSTASTFLEDDVSAHIVDLVDQVRLYRDSIQAGKKVVLVAHSQGNLFGNEAYTFLTSEEQASFDMVSVATPTNRVLDDYDSGSARYTTLCEDPIYTIPAPTFYPNISNIVDNFSFSHIFSGCVVEADAEDVSSTPPFVIEVEKDWLYHAFVTSYLAEDSNSRAQIKDDILHVLESLVGTPSPPPPSTAFATGDAVELVAPAGTSVVVWDAPDGSTVGTREAGAQGTVVGGPVYSTALGVWMWEVAFEDGLVGWVAEEFLAEVGAPPPIEGLLAYYPFDGDATDVSGNAQNGMVYGATPSTDRFGNAGGALSFDGVNDYVAFPNLGTSQFTISTFIQVPTSSQTNSRFFQGWDSGESFAIGYRTLTDTTGWGCNHGYTTPGPYLIGSFHPYVSGTLIYGEQHLCYPVDLSDEQWHAVAVSYDGETAKVYLDAQMVASFVFDDSVVSYYTSWTEEYRNSQLNFTLGRFAREYSYFRGAFDDVYVYNRALSDAEIAAIQGR